MTLDYQSPGFQSGIPPEQLRRAITPLRMIFWGGLLCSLDFTITVDNFRFDILNDTVGTILVFAGLGRLAQFQVPGRFAPWMKFIRIMSALAIATSIDSCLSYSDPTWLTVLRTLLGMAKLVAVVMFTTCMLDLAGYAALNEVARSWWFTRMLYIVMYLIPFGLFYCASLVAIVMGQRFNLNLGPAGLCLVPVMLVPLFHFFISTSRMKRVIEAQTAPMEGFV